MEKNIQCLLLKSNQVLVAEIEEVMADIGEPDCRIINPYLLDKNGELSLWIDFSDQSNIMIRSDDVLTFVNPNKKVLNSYLEKVK